MKTSDLASQIGDKRLKLFIHTALAENEALLRSDAARAQREQMYLDNVLPLVEKIIDFPRDVSILANQNNLDFRFNFLPETPSTKTEPGYISFSLRANGGTIAQLMNFIKQLEQSRYFIKFIDYTIVEETGKYTLNINGQIFSQ